MAWPSWFATGSRPTAWKDWSSIYKSVMPREWNKGLFSSGSEALGDLKAFGESLALVRDLLEWVLQSYFPRRDANAVLLSEWESAFGVGRKGTTADRQSLVIARFRRMGEGLSLDLAKSVLCRAWGSDDPADVSYEVASLADLTTAWGSDPTGDLGSTSIFVRSLNNVHWYHTSESTAPDQDLLQDLITAIKPTWEYWSGGQYKRLKWGTPGEEGAWDQATWG